MSYQGIGSPLDRQSNLNTNAQAGQPPKLQPANGWQRLIPAGESDSPLRILGPLFADERSNPGAA